MATNVLISADDLGKNHENNIAVMTSLAEGWCDRASIILNMWGSDEAIEMCRGAKNLNVALHLNILRSKPLSNAIKGTFFSDKDGNLRIPTPYEYIFKGLAPKNIEAIREECEAQMDKFRSYGFTSTHIDSHGWAHGHLAVALALRPLMEKYGFKTIRTMTGGFMGLVRKQYMLRSYYKITQRMWKDWGYVEDSWSGISQEFIDGYGLGKIQGNVEVYVHPRIVDGVIADYKFSRACNAVPMQEVRTRVMRALEYKDRHHQADN